MNSIMISRTPMSLFGYEMHYRKQDSSAFLRAKPLEFEFDPEDKNVTHLPCASFTEDEAQQLLQELWAAGLRPKQQYTSKNIEHIGNHLQDMRTIAFSKLNISKP